MTTAVQIYQQPANVVPLHKTEAELAANVGLTAYAAQLVTPYKAMSGEEYELWQFWLPTGYKTGLDVSKSYVHWKCWENYQHQDGVPTDVLALLPKYLSEFDWLQIRTPEGFENSISGHALDPVLIGAIGEKRYLLARWGESAEALIGLDTIREIRDFVRWARGHSLLDLMLPAGLTFVCGLLIGGILISGGIHNGLPVMTVFGIICGLCGVPLQIAYMRRRQIYRDFMAEYPQLAWITKRFGA